MNVPCDCGKVVVVDGGVVVVVVVDDSVVVVSATVVVVDVVGVVRFAGALDVVWAIAVCSGVDTELAADGRAVREWVAPGVRTEVQALAWKPDGSTPAAGFKEGVVVAWNAAGVV